MKIDILTLFPKMFSGPFDNSLIKKAQENNKVKINIYNLRDFTKDKHKMVDDKPFGGGAGMLIKIEPVYNAIKKLKKRKTKIILTSPKGKKLTQDLALKLAKEKHLIIICGHYEGFDHRVHDYLIDEEISIGDYILTGGELPAMVITETVVRLVDGVVGNKESIKDESHSKKGYLEYPQYTRPEKFKKWRVPKILLSGNHKEIQKWKKENTKKI